MDEVWFLYFYSEIMALYIARIVGTTYSSFTRCGDSVHLCILSPPLAASKKWEPIKIMWQMTSNNLVVIPNVSLTRHFSCCCQLMKITTTFLKASRYIILSVLPIFVYYYHEILHHAIHYNSRIPEYTID